MEQERKCVEVNGFIEYSECILCWAIQQYTVLFPRILFPFFLYRGRNSSAIPQLSRSKYIYRDGVDINFVSCFFVCFLQLQLQFLSCFAISHLWTVSPYFLHLNALYAKLCALLLLSFYFYTFINKNNTHVQNDIVLDVFFCSVQKC